MLPTICSRRREMIVTVILAFIETVERKRGVHIGSVMMTRMLWRRSWKAWWTTVTE